MYKIINKDLLYSTGNCMQYFIITYKEKTKNISMHMCMYIYTHTQAVLCLVTQSCPTLCDLMGCRPPGSSVHEILQEYWSRLPFLAPGDLPNPGIEPRSPTLQADSLPAELPGKPKNPGVCSLPLLQGVFPTQGLNRGLLHCRRILYQWTHLESSYEYTYLYAKYYYILNFIHWKEVYI